MEFTVSTKPLKTAVSMSLISGNITKANPISSVVQLTADKTTLRLNTQSTGIKAEIKLKGSGTDDSGSFIVDINLFKSLINSITASQVTLCFEDNYLQISAGGTTLSVERDDNYAGMSMNRPIIPTKEAIESADPVDVNNWKFAKNHQAYAVSKIANPYPVFTYFYYGEGGDVLAGDYVHSLFNASNSGQIDKNCLVSPFIVNLMSTMPMDAKFVKVDDAYVVAVVNDSYEYYAQLEFVTDAERVSAYSADVILGLTGGYSEDGVTVAIADISAAVTQATLLKSGIEPEVKLSVSTDSIRVQANNVDSTLEGKGTVNNPYQASFDLAVFKSVIAKCPDKELTIYPSISEGEVVGITFVGENFSVVLGSKVGDSDVS